MCHYAPHVSYDNVISPVRKSNLLGDTPLLQFQSVLTRNLSLTNCRGINNYFQADVVFYRYLTIALRVLPICKDFKFKIEIIAKVRVIFMLLLLKMPKIGILRGFH